jgi:Fic family protein
VIPRGSTTPYSEENDLLIENEDERAEQEARNGLLQFDEVVRLIELASSSRHIEITPELVCDLNRIAIQGIRRSAGSFRSIPIAIENTPHEPPSYTSVPALVDEMCAYVNANWWAQQDDLADALHISSFLMWRLNWIHPFRDGNGRTSRAVSYLALSARIGQLIPGTPTIADLIVENKQPYYEALDAADAAWKEGALDVSVMEELLRRLLTEQLTSGIS